MQCSGPWGHPPRCPLKEARELRGAADPLEDWVRLTPTAGSSTSTRAQCAGTKDYLKTVIMT